MQTTSYTRASINLYRMANRLLVPEIVRILPLASILLLAAILRLYQLDHNSVWADKGISLRRSTRSLTEIISGNSRPLYFAILHYWINIFGASVFAARAISVIFGILTVAATYKCGELLYSRRVGLTAALFVTLSTFHIAHSQEIRMYSLLPFISILSFYGFFRTLVTPSPTDTFRHYRLLYVIATVILMYTHNYAVFIVLSQNIFYATLLVTQPRLHGFTIRSWVVIQLSIATMCLPMLIFLYGNTQSIGDSFWIPKPGFGSVFGTFKTYASESSYLLAVMILLVCMAPFAYRRISGSLAGNNLFHSIETFQWNIYIDRARNTYMLLVWMTTSILVPFITSQINIPFYWTRYTIASSIAFYILAARGAETVQHRGIRLLLLALILIIGTKNIFEYYAAPSPEQWREAASQIDRLANTDDILVFNGVGPEFLFDVYSQSRNLTRISIQKAGEVIDVSTVSEILRLIDGRRQVWLIVSRSRGGRDMIIETILQSYALSEESVFNGITVYRFTKL